MLLALTVAAWYAHGSVISSNEGDTNVSASTKVGIVSWHLTNDQFNALTAQFWSTGYTTGTTSKPLILSDDTQQADTNRTRVLAWITKIRDKSQANSDAMLGRFHYEHLDAGTGSTLPSMYGDPEVMASLGGAGAPVWSPASIQCLNAIKDAVDGADAAFKAAATVTIPSPVNVSVSANGKRITINGKTAVLIGFSGYGTMISNDWRDYFANFFSMLRDHRVNYTRVFVTDMYTAANPDGFPAHDAVTRPDRGAVPFQKNGDHWNSYDLYTISDDFLTRLSDFVTAAKQNGIVVQLCLFDYWDHWRKGAANDADRGYYGTWLESPYYRANSLITEPFLGKDDSMPYSTKFYTSADIAWVNTGMRKSLLREIINAVGTNKNVIFEIINEPGAKTPTSWQTGMVDWLYPLLP